MKRKLFILLFFIPFTTTIAQNEVTFTIRIENVSTDSTLMPSDGSKQPVPMSPGVWAVHSTDAPFFMSGVQDRGDGLEAIAEDGSPGMLSDSLKGQSEILRSGVFNMPMGAGGPGPLLPGGVYEFNFTASPGARLSFAAMFVPSNDVFFAPDEQGIALFDTQNNPLSGDFTSSIKLWDAGTEANEEPGVGPNQVQRQSGANTGPPDSNNTVRLVNDGFTYPDVASVIKVTIAAVQTTPFIIRIENVSNDSTLQPSDGSLQFVPLSPGVWAVHEDPEPLFTPGQPDRGDGLESVAEDGNPVTLVTNLAGQTGVLQSALFNTPDGAGGPGPLLPGSAYEFTVNAAPGAHLSFATMFVPSNDLFLGPDEQGIALFDGQNNPMSGDFTSSLKLWDTGTEANEEPGVGPNQVQRQSGPNTGPADPDTTVRLVNDGFTYPDVANVIRLTINPVIPMPFTVRIENVSTDSTLRPSDGSKQPVPMSPGVWVVHNSLRPLFTDGATDRGDGLEAIAEDGDPTMLASVLENQSGVFRSDLFNMPVGASGPGPLLPGNAYEFSFDAYPGSYLSFATMFVPSNDVFLAPGEGGIALFDSNGEPISGEVTDQVQLWDAGTETNEEPGVGPNQVQRQSGPNTGPADPDTTVRLVDDGFTYPQVNEVIRVIVNPTPTSVDEVTGSVPLTFSLEQNYPNPFNPGTSIKYTTRQTGRVKLSIYNLLGQKVVDLVDQIQSAGNYQVTWDGRDKRGLNVTSGIYVYRLDVKGRSVTRKMTLLK